MYTDKWEEILGKEGRKEVVMKKRKKKPDRLGGRRREKYKDRG